MYQPVATLPVLGSVRVRHRRSPSDDRGQGTAQPLHLLRCADAGPQEALGTDDADEDPGVEQGLPDGLAVGERAEQDEVGV